MAGASKPDGDENDERPWGGDESSKRHQCAPTSLASALGNAYTALDVSICSPHVVGDGLDCTQTMVGSKLGHYSSHLRPLRRQNIERSCGEPVAIPTETRFGSGRFLKLSWIFRLEINLQTAETWFFEQLNPTTTHTKRLQQISSRRALPSIQGTPALIIETVAI